MIIVPNYVFQMPVDLPHVSNEVRETAENTSRLSNIELFLRNHPSKVSRFKEARESVSLAMQYLEGLLKDADEMAKKGKEILQASKETKEKADQYLTCLRESYHFLENPVSFVASMKKND